MPLSTHDTPPSTTYYPTPTSDHKLPAFGMSYQEVTNTLKGGADTPMVYEGGDEDSSQFSMSPREEHDQDSEMCLRIFETWPQTKQTEYVEQLIARMSFHQHEHIYSILMPMLQRDFITVLPSEWLGVAEGRGGGKAGGGCTSTSDSYKEGSESTSKILVHVLTTSRLGKESSPLSLSLSKLYLFKHARERSFCVCCCQFEVYRVPLGNALSKSAVSTAEVLSVRLLSP